METHSTLLPSIIQTTTHHGTPTSPTPSGTYVLPRRRPTNNPGQPSASTTPALETATRPPPQCLPTAASSDDTTAPAYQHQRAMTAVTHSLSRYGAIQDTRIRIDSHILSSLTLFRDISRIWKRKLHWRRNPREAAKTNGTNIGGLPTKWNCIRHEVIVMFSVSTDLYLQNGARGHIANMCLERERVCASRKNSLHAILSTCSCR